MRPAVRHTGTMPGIRVVVGVCLAAVILAACGPSPTPSLTRPPPPADAVSWRDHAWASADLPRGPFDVDGERIVAVGAGPAGLVAVGYREAGGVRDGAIWSSSDGSGWSLVDAPAIFADVELLDVASGPAGFAALGVANVGSQDLRPQTVMFHSDDGQEWQRLPQVPGSLDTYPSTLAGGAGGLLAAGFDAMGGAAVWTSPDGRAWVRVAMEGAGTNGIVDPQTAPGGFLALGTNEDVVPVSLRSTDGISWTASSIEAGPDAVANRLVVGRWGHIAQGLLAPGCGPDVSCAGQPLAWWSADATTWLRLPSDGSPTSNGGSIIVAAGDHGFLAVDGASAWSSADGWVWKPLPEPGDGSIVVNDAVVRDDIIVAVGEEYGEDGSSVGRILVAR